MEMKQEAKAGDRVSGRMIKRPQVGEGARASGVYEVVCRRADGSVRWREQFPNLVVNAGLDYLLDAGLSGGTPITTWYLGLTAASPTPAAGDTMGSHAGWTEFTAYSESVRQTWPDDGVSGQSVTNGTAASFSINSDASSIGGVFLTSDSTKSGSTGTLFSVGAFSGGNKAADNGDTLEVTYTASQTSS